MSTLFDVSITRRVFVARNHWNAGRYHLVDENHMALPDIGGEPFNGRWAAIIAAIRTGYHVVNPFGPWHDPHWHEPLPRGWNKAKFRRRVQREVAA